MFEINLLPWRKQKRKLDIYRQYLSLFAGLVMGVIIWGMVHESMLRFNKMITKKIQALSMVFEKNESQAAQIKQLKHQYEQWTSHERFMADIQKQQKTMFDKFRETSLVTELPIVFNQINYTKESIIFLGKVPSVSSLKILINKLLATPYVTSIKVRQIHRVSRGENYHFEVIAQ